MTFFFNRCIEPISKIRRPGFLKKIISFVTLFLSFQSQIYAQCTAAIGSNINPIKGCETLTIQFNDLTSGAVLSRSWNFGDGSATTGSSSPVHSFSAGVIGDTTYVVTLSIQCISGGPSTAHDTVLVYKKPKVAILANKTTVCALKDSVCFSNLSSSGPGYTFLWNFGDFTTSSSYQPCHTYSTGGTYSVQLTVTSPHGCANSITSPAKITVIPAPTIDFTLAGTLGCAPMAQTFTNITDTLSTSFSSWAWNFGDGSPVVNGYNPPAHTFTLPGTYYISLSATNSLGCSNLTSKAIIVRTTPPSGISASSPVCIGSPSLITLTGTSGPSATYTWNFNGGTALPGSGSVPQNVSWSSAGTKSVNLTVSDSGCSSSTSVSVIVHPNPSVSLTVSPKDTICQGQQAIFTASPASLNNYTFYYNGISVQSGISTTYSNSNIHSNDSISVVGKNSFGCVNTSSSIKMKVTPLPLVTLSSNIASACVGDTIKFTASPSGYTKYSFFQGSLLLQGSSTNTYSAINWVNGDGLDVIATNQGCSSQSNLITPAIIQPLPTPQVNCGTSTNTSIQFTWLTISGASGYLVSVNGGAFGAPSSGNLGTTQQITGLNPGDSATIRVIAIGPAPCGNSPASPMQTCYAKTCAGISFTINPNQTICKGDSITLTLSGFSITNPNVSWNGLTSLPNNNSYKLFPASNTTIPVVVINPSQPACKAVTNNFIIRVNPIPSVTLSSTNSTACAGDTLKFLASPPGYTQYSFFQGSLLLQGSSSSTYSAISWINGDVIDVIATNQGCSSQSNLITPTIVQPLPTPQVNCGTSTNTSIQFTWLPISGASGYLVSVNGGAFAAPSSGNLGTSQQITGLNPGDSATIRVIAIGPAPCGNSPASPIQTCYAKSCSGISFTMNPYQTICSGDTITLSLSGFSITNPSVSWNGMASVPNNNSYKLAPAANTSIPVVVTNLLQPACKAITDNFVIHVNPLPVLTLSSNNASACVGDTLKFTASPAGYTKYSFFQGSLQLQGSSRNTYSITNWINGNSINVIATNQGCSSQSNLITPAIVQPLPTPQVNCGTSTNTSIQFTWLSISGATGYLVSVNGGAFAAPSSGNLGTTQQITGLNPGDSATIRVIAIGPSPCGNSLASPLQTCYAKPCTGISFTITPNQTICNGDSIILSLSGFSITNPSISWNGLASLPNNNSYKLTPTANTTVPVVVTNLLQPTCKAVTDNFIIHVNPLPTVTLAVNPSNDTICQGIQSSIVASPAGYTTYSFYNGGTLLQNSNSSTLTASTSVAGNFSIKVTTTNLGCQFTSSSIPLVILPGPSVSLTSVPAKNTICYGDTVLYSASPIGYSSYSFYDGSTLLQNSPSASLSLSGISIGNGHTISVIATNSKGCNSKSSNTLLSNVLPPPAIQLTCSDTTQNICAGKPVTFNSTPTNLITYVFYSGSSPVQNSTNSSYTTSSVVSGKPMSVVGINASGCKSLSSNSFTFIVKPTPIAHISSTDTTLCAGTSVSLTAILNPVIAGTTVGWSTGSSSQTITVSPASTTTYVLSSSLNGCVGKKDSLKILVDNSPVPITSAGPDRTICLGEKATLSGSGGATMNWSPAVNLNSTSIFNPIASPTTTTTYTLLTSNLYCTSSASITITVDTCLTDITKPIPSAITPNGDGANDYFIIPDIKHFPNNSITIYNRWGNVVYNKDQYLNEWDGKSTNGNNLPDAIYYYILDLGTGRKPYTGFVLINR
jgi:gliding motility-associated-like protein